MASSAAPNRFAFIFPMASGHINPSLAVARALVEQGHEVHYLCREQMRTAIEDTGSFFHSDLEVESELYEGREVDLFGAQASFVKEHGLEGDGMLLSMMKVWPLMLEQMLPGVLRWLTQLQPRAVVYCPLMNREAPLISKILGIPSVALLTTAGPGSCAKAMQEFFQAEHLTIEELFRHLDTFKPHDEACRRVAEVYGLNIDTRPNLQPFGKLDVLRHSHVTLVTTCEDLQDPIEPELEAFYRENNVAFAAVGPLLDKEGAKRAAGHKFRSDSEGDVGHEQDLVARIRAARAAGRPVVLASMGTVITGDSHHWGWEGRLSGPDGRPQGLTGRELCQAVWGATFDVFGSDAEDTGALLIVSLGPQPNALGNVRAPPNAVCMPMVPQVDVLKAGVDVFLTHGGQNSFTEALSVGVPMVVCPGFADQPVNARKAAKLGVGLKVDRPNPAEDEREDAAKVYRIEAAQALRRVVAEPCFREAAQRCAERLCQAGGVPRAVELVLEAAGLTSNHALAAAKVAEVKAVESGAQQQQQRQQALLAGA